MIANGMRDPKKRRQPFRPEEFDPYQHKEKRRDAIMVNDMRMLRPLFVGKEDK